MKFPFRFLNRMCTCTTTGSGHCGPVFSWLESVRQSRQDAAPTVPIDIPWERHVYMDVLMSCNAGMRESDAAANASA